MKRSTIFLVFLTLTTCVGAQTKLSPELLWKLGRVGSMSLSPDQSTLLYELTYYDLEANKGNKDLYLITLKDGKIKALTGDAGSESAPSWRPDGRKATYMASDGNSMQLWEINPDGSARNQVTQREGGISAYLYAPDATKIAFKADVKTGKSVQDQYPDLPKANARIIDDLMYRHWDSWDDFTSTHIFIASYADGKATTEAVDVMEGEPYDANDFSWSKDGNWLVYSSKKLAGKEFAVSTNTDIYLYSVKDKTTRNLSEGMPGYDNSPVFSPDGKKIAWLSMERPGFEADRKRIFVYDAEKNTKEEITVGFDQNADNLVWAADGKAIFFISGTKATCQVYMANTDTKKIRQITNGRHDYKNIVAGENVLIGAKQSMSMPTEIYGVDITSGAEEPLTHINRDILKDVKMGEVEERWVKTTDDKQMLVWVIYPPDFDKTKKYPTLLYCQGGPQSTVSQFFSYRWNFQLMAANGYIIVAPNRRGLPGFGQAWNDQISGDWGGQNIRDYLSAIDAVSEEPFVDKDHRGAVGASYGGYSTFWLAGHHDKRFKAFVSHCGLFNLESWYGTTEEYFFADFDMKGAYWNVPTPKSYTDFSPHKFVGQWDTPMLVIHGQKDFRVPVTQGMGAFQAARLQGIPSRFLYYPEEGHWVLQPQNGVLWHRIFFEWLDTYLK